jgi:hypothetical protein
MKKRAGWILIMALSCSALATAQNLGLGAGLGLSTSRMNDLKYIQEYILGTYPVEGKIISSFPAYTTGSVRIVRQVHPMVRIGAGYAFTATGGRSNYSDYTGSINTDILANSHRLGAFVSYAVFSGDRYDLSIFGQLDANFTRIDITTSLYVLGISDGRTSKYNSFSPNGTAGLEFLFHFKDFSLGADGGYLVDLPGDLTDRENGDEMNDPRDPQRILTSEWTGWRLQVKVLIWFDR